MKSNNNFQSIEIFEFLATGFGFGNLPVAPGTWGTLVAIPIYLLLISFTKEIYILVIIFGFLFGIYICNKVSDKLSSYDHPSIVWDEIIGYLITMSLVKFSISLIVIGFILFRLFDIFKPWPIRYLERKISGGLGIMLDDALAGIYSAIILWLIYKFICE